MPKKFNKTNRISIAPTAKSNDIIIPENENAYFMAIRPNLSVGSQIIERTGDISSKKCDCIGILSGLYIAI